MCQRRVYHAALPAKLGIGKTSCSPVIEIQLGDSRRPTPRGYSIFRARAHTQCANILWIDNQLVDRDPKNNLECKKVITDQLGYALGRPEPKQVTEANEAPP